MDFCYVEFIPKDVESLRRSSDLFDRIKLAKEQEELVDESPFLEALTESERSYFWNPTPEESKEWNDEWFSTPVEIRLSPEMPTPQWHFGSMLDAFANGDYELLYIREEAGKFYLAFNPFGYPYGGTGCMTAFLESFGHQIVGIDDGTGYTSYTPRTNVWKPKNQRLSTGA